jgi:hypothetical protein
MKYIYLTLFALLLGSCKKEDPAPPAPAPPPYICCPTTAPALILPADNATITAPITWRWNKVPGAANYSIHASCDWTGQNGQNYYALLLSATVSDTFYVQTTLPTIPVSWNGATGTWKVTPKGSDGTTGPVSEVRSFTVQQ